MKHLTRAQSVIVKSKHTPEQQEILDQFYERIRRDQLRKEIISDETILQGYATKKVATTLRELCSWDLLMESYGHSSPSQEWLEMLEYADDINLNYLNKYGWNALMQYLN